MTAVPSSADRTSSRGLSDVVGRVAVVTRGSAWLFPKLPPLLLVAYAQLLVSETRPAGVLARWLLAVATICCLAAYGYVVNDVFDVEADRRAGKPNSLARMTPAGRMALCALFAIAGLSSILVLERSAAAVLVANYLLATLYSAPPVRFKERGVLGVLADAAGVHALPTLFMVFVFAAPGSAGLDAYVFPVTATLWAFLFGLRGIVSHQIWDYDNDRRSALTTMVTRAGPQRCRSAVRLVLFPAEMAVLLALIATVAPTASAVWAILIAAVAIDVLQWWVWGVGLDPAPLAEGRYMPPANLYQAWLPLGLAVQLAVRDRDLLLLPLLHAALFFEPLKRQTRDVARLLVNAGRGEWRRGRPLAEPVVDK